MTYGLKEAHDELLSELQELQEENARLRSCLSEDEESARLMIGEYNELREKYEEVCETSAMLRADMAAARERQAKLRAENTKLRELCADLYDFADRAEYATDREWKSYSDRASELGVEVDG